MKRIIEIVLYLILVITHCNCFISIDEDLGIVDDDDAFFDEPDVPAIKRSINDTTTTLTEAEQNRTEAIEEFNWPTEVISDALNSAQSIDELVEKYDKTFMENSTATSATITTEAEEENLNSSLAWSMVDGGFNTTVIVEPPSDMINVTVPVIESVEKIPDKEIRDEFNKEVETVSHVSLEVSQPKSPLDDLSGYVIEDSTMEYKAAYDDKVEMKQEISYVENSFETVTRPFVNETESESETVTEEQQADELIWRVISEDESDNRYEEDSVTTEEVSSVESRTEEVEPTETSELTTERDLNQISEEEVSMNETETKAETQTLRTEARESQIVDEKMEKIFPTMKTKEEQEVQTQTTKEEEVPGQTSEEAQTVRTETREMEESQVVDERTEENLSMMKTDEEPKEQEKEVQTQTVDETTKEEEVQRQAVNQETSQETQTMTVETREMEESQIIDERTEENLSMIKTGEEPKEQVEEVQTQIVDEATKEEEVPTMKPEKVQRQAVNQETSEETQTITPETVETEESQVVDERTEENLSMMKTDEETEELKVQVENADETTKEETRTLETEPRESDENLPTMKPEKEARELTQDIDETLKEVEVSTMKTEARELNEEERQEIVTATNLDKVEIPRVEENIQRRKRIETPESSSEESEDETSNESEEEHEDTSSTEKIEQEGSHSTSQFQINQIFMEETATIATILPVNYPTIEEVQDEIYYGIESTTQIQLPDSFSSVGDAATTPIDENNIETTLPVTMPATPTTPTTTQLNQLLLEPHSQVIASKNTRELIEIGVKNALAQEFSSKVSSSSSTGAARLNVQPEMVIATTITFIVLSILTCMVVAVILLRKRLRSIRVDDTPQQA